MAIADTLLTHKQLLHIAVHTIGKGQCKQSSALIINACINVPINHTHSNTNAINHTHSNMNSKDNKLIYTPNRLRLLHV